MSPANVETARRISAVGSMEMLERVAAGEDAPEWWQLWDPDVFRFRDGRVIHASGYRDRSEALEAARRA